MIKKKTAVRRSLHSIVGGDWIVAENNARYSSVNLVPELPLSTPYRGNFQIVQINSAWVNALNTAFCDEEDDKASQSAGEIQLRWMKIVKDPASADKYIAQPQEKTVTVPHMDACRITSNGWVYLKMNRASGIVGDAEFQNKVLGDVCLRFHLFFAEQLPDDTKNSCILPLAAVTLDDKGNIDEIIQQQYGPGVLWIPVDIPEDSSSAYIEPEISSSSETVEPDVSSSSSEMPPVILPDDSSSSTVNDKITIEVTLTYNEISKGDFMGTGVETHTTNLLLTGQFIANSSYPTNGYTVKMTGSITYDYGDGNPETEKVEWDINVYRNTTSSRWDVYHLRINDWAAYYQGQSNEDDTDFSTPVYTFPDLQSMTTYPLGNITVEHHLIYGASNTIPDNDLTSLLDIAFVRK